jgi:hypothetical protein
VQLEQTGFDLDLQKQTEEGPGDPIGITASPHPPSPKAKAIAREAIIPTGTLSHCNQPKHLGETGMVKLPDLAGEPKGDEWAGALPWTDEGVIVPHGSRARMEYGRGSQVYEGRFLNGKLVVDGQGYKSLSAAADAVAITKAGKKTFLNGWLYWKVQFPDETQWRSLQEMRSGRKRYRIM